MPTIKGTKIFLEKRQKEKYKTKMQKQKSMIPGNHEVRYTILLA